ncbi:MAG: phosphate ABC transporter permease subunit PstC [Bdellovibrionales bacterium]|nr:phosphate ABC transporter permease subunit PstC [Bdellovibrionales bacterium]
MSTTPWLLFFALTYVGYLVGLKRAVALARSGEQKLCSLPRYYGYYVALWTFVPAALFFFLWRIVEPSVLRHFALGSVSGESLEALDESQLRLLWSKIQNAAAGVISVQRVDPEFRPAVSTLGDLSSKSGTVLLALFFGVSVLTFGVSISRINFELQARKFVERAVRVGLFLSSLIAVLTTVGIVFSLIFESFRFFQIVSPIDFLFGLKWSPQIAMRADQVASAGAFGAVPLITGTVLIAFLAMCVAGPLGLLSAVYLSEYASKPLRKWAKPMLEILAGIPTVVYGFFAALTVAPFIRQVGQSIGLTVSSESALAAGVVMGVMIIPFVSSLSDDVINSVPQRLRDGSLALGATKSETIRQVILPAALPGIVGAFLLAISRAIGETMIVVMAAGLAANLTLNPLENVTTVTVQIVTTLIGDQEFDSAKTLSAFALGLMLFVVTLIFNIIALYTVKKYREKYD